MTSLSELGKKKMPPPADTGLDFGVASEPVAAAVARATGPHSTAQDWPQIEVEAVIGGCLMRLHINDMSPAQVLPWIKSLDPACKVRDDFPAKGGGAFGKRDTKRARLKAITLKASASGTFIDLVCKGEKTVSVAVSKKNADGFVSALAATGRISADNLDELQAAVDAKTAATVMLEEEEAVEVEYWTTEDGKNFMEALHAASPKT
jgi:hypothetical protein